MRKRKVKKYSGFKIEKRDMAGELVEVYESTGTAMRAERMSHKVLKDCIDSGNAHNGFTFSYGDKSEFKMRLTITLEIEREEELFDVDKFGKYYDNGRWEENSSIQPLKLKLKRHGL